MRGGQGESIFYSPHPSCSTKRGFSKHVHRENWQGRTKDGVSGEIELWPPKKSTAIHQPPGCLRRHIISVIPFSMSHFMVLHIVCLLKPVLCLWEMRKVVTRAAVCTLLLSYIGIACTIVFIHNERDLCKPQVTYLASSVNMNELLPSSWRSPT